MYPTLATRLFHTLYRNVDGYKLWAGDRDRLCLDDPALTYGEIAWDSFVDILAEVHYSGGYRTFYDLGSGTGKAVVAAALLGTFDHVIGVEILPELYRASKNILFAYNKRVRPLLPSDHQKTVVDFVQGDFFNYNWLNGDVIFVQTTCMSEPQIAELQTRLEQLKPGSVVITTSRSLWSPQFKLLLKKKYPFGWGDATVFIQKKLADKK